MSVIDVSEATFDKEVIRSNIPVIADVWAEWCGPCRIYSPVIEEVARMYEGKIKFVKINADDNQDLVTKYNIMSIPTTLLIEKGIVKAMNVGALPKDSLRKWVDKNL